MGIKSEYCGELLVKKGFWACYAFETARDMLLKKRPRVIKILTNADLFQLSKLFPDIMFRENRTEHAFLFHDDHDVHFYISDYADRAVNLPGMIEREKLEQKKAIRYALFSVNCFFYNIRTGVFYDPLDSYPVLKNRLIQTIEPPERASENFPSIALKTAKVYSETGFIIEHSLSTYLENHSPLHPYKAIDEEVAGDFLDLCVSGRAYDALTLLNNWRVLDLLLPEVTVLKDVHQDKEHHPEGDGFLHTLNCLKCVKKPTKNLIMAILLHDTGKAEAKERSNKGLAFPYHSSVSREMARRVLKRFHFIKDDREEILFLVENHMILNAIELLPESRLKKFFTSPYFPSLLELYRADLESGYHNIKNYYLASRKYREFLRREKLKSQGIIL